MKTDFWGIIGYLIGGAIGLAGIYTLIWSFAIGCILLGGTPEVCGL